MGSLMAGWDSPVQDLKAEKLRRNNSLTREEIKAFWRSKEDIKEQHLSALSAHTEKMIQEDEFEKGEMRQRRSSSVPRSQGVQMKDTEKSESLEKIIQKNGWWNSSKWAFLNEPPVIGTEEGPKYKYASQIHVASKPLNINTT